MKSENNNVGSSSKTTQKLTKSDVKGPDAVTKELQKGFIWTTQHSQIVLSIVGVFLVIGLSWAGYSAYSEKTQNTAMEKFYPIEKAYLDKKAEREASKAPATDMQTDYGNVVTDLEAFVKAEPKTTAAQLAAIYVSDIYEQYNKFDEGLSVLNQVQAGNKGLVQGLVTLRKGTLLANQNKCSDAITHWHSLVKESKVDYLSSTAALRMALCHEQMNDMTKAKESYQLAIEKGKESAVAKTAEKYLRLLSVNETASNTVIK